MWRSHVELRAMDGIAHTLIMDCRIKMSLHTFKCRFEASGSLSLWGLVLMKPHVSSFNQRLQPPRVSAVLCRLKDEDWKVLFISAYKRREHLYLDHKLGEDRPPFKHSSLFHVTCLTFIVWIFIQNAIERKRSHLGIYCVQLWWIDLAQRETTKEINGYFKGKNRFVQIAFKSVQPLWPTFAAMASKRTKSCIKFHMQGGFYCKSKKVEKRSAINYIPHQGLSLR